MNRALQPLAFDELAAVSVLRPGTSGLRVGACRVEPDLDRVSGPVGESTLEPKAMAVLVYLAARPGQVVSTDELIDAVWLGRPLGDNPVYKCIAQLRRALGDDPKAPTYIATVPKKGYRLIAPVAAIAVSDDRARGTEVPWPATTLPSPPRRALHPPHADTRSSCPDRRVNSRPARSQVARLARASGLLLVVLLSVVLLLLPAAVTRDRTPNAAAQPMTAMLAIHDNAGTAIPEAYAAYMRAHYYWSRNSSEGVARARDLFAQAVAVDPQFAAAWTDLGLVELAMRDAERTLSENLRDASKAAQRAIALAPEHAPAQVLLAKVEEREWHWSGSERAFRRAMAINPADVTAWFWYGELLVRTGRLDEARPVLQRARALEPFSLFIGKAVADPDFYAGHYDRASAQYLELLELDPGFSRARLFLGYAYEQQGRHAQAIAQFQQATAANDRLPAQAAIAHAQALAGQPDAARQTLAELAQMPRGVDPYLLAVIQVALGDPDTALRWLEAAYDARSQGMLDIAIDPRLAPLRADPRYRSLIARMGLAH